MPAGRVGDWRGACARLGCQRHTPLTRHTQNPAPPLPVGLVRGLGRPGRQTHTSDRAAGADKVKNPACPPKFLRSPLRELHLPSGPAYHTQHTPHRPSCPHGLSDPPDLGTNTNAPKMQQDQPLQLTPLPPSAPCHPQAPKKRDCVCLGMSVQCGLQNQLGGWGCSWSRDQTANPGRRWDSEADAGTPEPERGLLPFQALMLVYSRNCRPRGMWGGS